MLVCDIHIIGNRISVHSHVINFGMCVYVRACVHACVCACMCVCVCDSVNCEVFGSSNHYKTDNCGILQHHILHLGSYSELVNDVYS